MYFFSFKFVVIIKFTKINKQANKTHIPPVGSDYRYYMMIYLVCLNMSSVVVQLLAFQML